MTSTIQNGEGVELLPCPFCGGDAERITIEEEGDNFGGDVIQCMGICGASSHVEFGRKENLVSLWNTRHSLAREPATADVEREALFQAFMAGWEVNAPDPDGPIMQYFDQWLEDRRFLAAGRQS